MTTPDETPEPDEAAEPAPRNSRRRWLWIVPLVLVVLAGAVLVGSYRVYGEWPWSKYPTRLHACGRGFERGANETLAEIEANGDTLVRVGKVPGWLNSGKLWTTSAGDALPGQVCHVRMWVQTSSDGYRLYSLPGGP